MKVRRLVRFCPGRGSNWRGSHVGFLRGRVNGLGGNRVGGYRGGGSPLLEFWLVFSSLLFLVGRS